MLDSLKNSFYQNYYNAYLHRIIFNYIVFVNFHDFSFIYYFKLKEI